MGLKGPVPLMRDQRAHPLRVAQIPLYGGAAMYIGVDYHKKYIVATKMDESGTIMEQVRLNNDPDTLLGYAHTLPTGSKIALEATEGWYHFYELLENQCPDIYLAHPLKTRAIAEARIKTDKVDSTMLAHLLRTNLLPHSYIPPREIRDMREILRYRASLVSLKDFNKEQGSCDSLKKRDTHGVCGYLREEGSLFPRITLLTILLYHRAHGVHTGG